MIKKILQISLICSLIIGFSLPLFAGSDSAERESIRKLDKNFEDSSSSDVFTIKGEVVWQGPKPVVYPVPTTAYRGACGKRRSMSAFRLKKCRLWHTRLLDTVVWLEPVLQDMSSEEIASMNIHRKAVSSEPYIIQEKDCEYYPRISVIPVGATIHVVNDDRLDHWTVIQGEDLKKHQYIQKYGVTPDVFTFETPGIHHRPLNEPLVFKAKKQGFWYINSGMLRWMDAWVFIIDKIWYTTVDDKGLFEIPDVPRGVYRIYTWHPLLGKSNIVIKVPDDTKDDVSIGYYDVPDDFEEISSAVLTTSGEVWENNYLWQDVDEF